MMVDHLSSFLFSSFMVHLSFKLRYLSMKTWLHAGVDGGFDNQEPEYEETLNIVILPEHVSLPFPSVHLPEKVSSR